MVVGSKIVVESVVEMNVVSVKILAGINTLVTLVSVLVSIFVLVVVAVEVTVDAASVTRQSRTLDTGIFEDNK